jgi:arylsulfatase A-like enzyme
VTQAGSVSASPVDLMSIYPTLVELAGLPPNPQIKGEGLSIVPLLHNPKARWKHYALCTHERGNHSVRSKHFRYIRYQDGSEELYDHRVDPNEWNNLAHKPTSKAKAVMADHAKHLPSNEAPTGPSYYNGTALMKLTGPTYEWKTKADAKGDPAFKNAGKLKSQAWKTAK